MATMNISLPDKMKEWVEAQTMDGRYANASDFVRDIIRREQVKAERIAKLRELYLEGKASPSRTVERSELLRSIKLKMGIENGMAAE
jgi:antitoxin ParD1/3/4